MIYKTIILSLLITLSSCGDDLSSGLLGSAGSTTSSSSASSTCNCESDVNPVCASVNGNYITYKNGCLAQCAGYRYSTGTCNIGDCDSNSGPVCGIIHEDLDPRIFSSECTLLAAGADQTQDSDCDL